ncbi:MAG: hypothetical protein ACE5EP_02320 [Candidatus Methylomirabilales bacterium]
MEIVTLLIAVVALVIAVLAYIRTGGVQDLRAQVGSLDSVIDALRAKTADTLDRLGEAVRGSPETTLPLAPAPPAEETEDRQRRAETQEQEIETEIRQGATKASQKGTRTPQRGTRTRQKRTKTQKR